MADPPAPSTYDALPYPGTSTPRAHPEGSPPRLPACGIPH